MGYLIVSTFSFGGLFAFLTSGSLVYIDIYGVKVENFGYFFMLNIAIMAAFTVLNGKIVGKAGAERMLQFGLAMQTAAGFWLLIVAVFDLGFWPMALGIAWFIGMNSTIGANAAALILEHFGRIAGTANSVLGTPFRWRCGHWLHTCFSAGHQRHSNVGNNDCLYYYCSSWLLAINLSKLTEMTRLTIKDIARLSGVGKSTVSRVLNQDPKVSDKTRAKVGKIIAEQGFLPSNSARAMRGQGNRVIGIIVSRLTSSAENQVLSAMLPLLYAAHCEPIIVESRFDEKLVQDHLTLFRQKAVDGVILFSFSSIEQLDLSSWKQKLVVIARNHPGLTSIYYDDHSAVQQLMQTLLQKVTKLSPISVLMTMTPPPDFCVITLIYHSAANINCQYLRCRRSQF